MYAKLKQLMADAGYTVSAGDDWTASDSEQFSIFSRMVLGAPMRSPNQVLAYPAAFPEIFDKLDAVPVSVAAPVEAQPESMPEPAAAPIDPPADEQVFDVSGGVGQPPQALEIPEAPAPEVDEEGDQPTEEIDPPVSEEAPIDPPVEDAADEEAGEPAGDQSEE